jgi:TolA-binding protein
MLAAGLFLAACATKRDLEYIQMEVRALGVRQDSALQALTRSVHETNRVAMDSIEALSDALFDLRGDVSNRLAAIQDQQLIIGEILGQSQRSMAAMREEFNSQQQRFAEQLAARVPEGDSVEGGGSPEEQATPAGNDDRAEDIYDTGVRQSNRGNFSAARRAFEGFLEEYPNNDLAPSAYLHLGELRSQDDELEVAVDLYLKIPELFPTAEEVPDALYRAGLLCIELEDYTRARQFLERVVNTYPEHRNAELARGRLEDIP